MRVRLIGAMRLKALLERLMVYFRPLHFLILTVKDKNFKAEIKNGIGKFGQVVSDKLEIALKITSL